MLDPDVVKRLEIIGAEAGKAAYQPGHRRTIFLVYKARHHIEAHAHDLVMLGDRELRSTYLRIAEHAAAVAWATMLQEERPNPGKPRKRP